MSRKVFLPMETKSISLFTYRLLFVYLIPNENEITDRRKLNKT